MRSGPSSMLIDLPEINYYGYDINSSHIEYEKKKYPNKNFCKIKYQVNNQTFITCTWLKITCNK